MKRIALLALSILSLSAQTVVYENDFEVRGTQTNFNTSITDTNPTTGRYLGKFAGLTRQSATLSLSNLPPHQYITVSFDVLVAVTWDGNGRGYIDTNDLASYVPDSGPDIFKVTADDRTMVHTTFASHDLEFYRFQSYPGTYPQDAYRPGTGAVATNCLGAKWNLDFYNEKKVDDAILVKDALYHFEITYTNASESTVIDFRTFALSAGGFQNDYDEWWGLDNVKVTVSDEALTPLTDCQPQLLQSIVPNSTNQTVQILVVGEAGTELKVQHSVDVLQWVDERVVNFMGFHRQVASTKPKPQPPQEEGTLSAQSISGQNLRFWRVIQNKKKR